MSKKQKKSESKKHTGGPILATVGIDIYRDRPTTRTDELNRTIRQALAECAADRRRRADEATHPAVVEVLEAEAEDVEMVYEMLTAGDLTVAGTTARPANGPRCAA